jgi:hypothetical protein
VEKRAKYPIFQPLKMLNYASIKLAKAVAFCTASPSTSEVTIILGSPVAPPV